MPGRRLYLSEALFPARDVSLTSLVAGLSEPPAGPGADNLVTNEDSFPRVAGEIARKVPPGGVYLGVGPDQNFTYIARCRPRLAFLLDYRRRNLLLHLVHKALFALSPDRRSYLARLTARRPHEEPAADLLAAFAGVPMDRSRLDAAVAEVVGYLRPFHLVADAEWAELATIQAKLAGPGLDARFLALPMYPTLARLVATPDRDGRPAHVLAADAFYQEVRDAQLGDRIVPLVADFAGAVALPALATWLRARGLAVSLLYISDVEFFLLRTGRFLAYVENLARMPWAEGALVVRTSTREINHPGRFPGDSSTTIVRPVTPFLRNALAGRIRRPDDLFAD